jgi:DNA-binding MarR family transcriptional regulator
LTASPGNRRGGAPDGSTTRARPPEARAFEREYPGASWLATRTIRELEVVGSMAEAFVAKVARRHRLSHAALNALAVIEGNCGPVAAGEVSSRMHVTSGTMTGILDTLEHKGYVRRVADRDDRRSVLVDVTPEAQAVLDELLPEVQQACTARLATVDRGVLEGLLDSLAVVRQAIDAFEGDLPRPPPRRTPTRLQRSREDGS